MHPPALCPTTNHRVRCTGVATKVVTALRHGIPVVSTSEATRGIVDVAPPPAAPRGFGRAVAAAERSDVLTVHDDPAAFAEAAAALLLDGDAWRARSEASLRHTRRALSEPGLDVRLLSLLNRLLARRCAQHDEQAAAACAWRPRLMRAAWPGLRSFAWEVMGLDDGFLNATELRPDLSVVFTHGGATRNSTSCGP